MNLTNHLRDKIIEDMVESTTKKEAAALVKREHKMAQRLYNAVYSAGDRAAVDFLEPGWVRETSMVRVNIGGMDIQLNAAAPVRYRRTDDDSSRYGTPRLGAINNSALQQDVLDLEAAKSDHNTNVSRIRAQSKALLYSLHTYAQLERTWPEGKKFYVKYKPERVGNRLPAIVIEDLNKTLGIK